MRDIGHILKHVDDNLQASVDRFLRFLSFPSISSPAAGRDGIVACAEWLRAELASLGLDAQVIDTEGHPLVLGSSPKREGRLRALFYGHYDVQPVEPLDAWTTPPFEPSCRNEDGLRRIYARGASDSKSQVWSIIEALRAWRTAEGNFPVDVTVLLEGEEEAGSASLPKFIDTYRGELACDVAFITDSDMWSPTKPAITTRLKGLLHEKVTISTPNGDLHSGHFGTVAANPVRILAEILTAIHDEKGGVAIDGFYDGVRELSSELRRQWEALDLDEALAGVSLDGGVPESGRGAIELMWSRPGIDFNGIVGGNTGPSERSVLPSSASARLSFRLVDDQEPERIRSLFRSFVRARIPRGCSVGFEGEGGSSAVTVNASSPFIAATARALDAEWREPTLIKGTGGAVPLVGLLTERLGVDCIVTGFILGDDAIHAPNERYDVERLRKGIRSWARILSELER